MSIRNTEGWQSHHGSIFRQADGDSVHVTSGDSSQQSGVGEGDTCAERINKDGDDPISLTPRAQQRKLEEVRTRIAEQEKCMMSQRQRLENKKQFYEHLYTMYVSETNEMAQKEAEIEKMNAEIEEFKREARELRIINRNVIYRVAVEDQNFKDTTKYLRRFESQLKRTQMLTAKAEGIDDDLVVAYRKEKEKLKEAQESAERLQKLHDTHKENLEFVNKYLKSYFEEYGMINGGEDLIPSDVLKKILHERSAVLSHCRIDDHDDDDDIVFSTRMDNSPAPINCTRDSDTNGRESPIATVKATETYEPEIDTSPKLEGALGSLKTNSTVFLSRIQGAHELKRKGEEQNIALKTQEEKLLSPSRKANDSVKEKRTSRQRSTGASTAKRQVHTRDARTNNVSQKLAPKPQIDAIQAKCKTVTLPGFESRINVRPTTSESSAGLNWSKQKQGVKLPAVVGMRKSRCIGRSSRSTHTPAPRIGRSSSYAHTPAPPIGRSSSSTHTPAPPIGRSSSSTHSPAPPIGRSSSSTHSPAPPIGRSSSPSHTPAPPIERPSSSTHTPAPPIGRSSSSTHSPAPPIGRSSSSTHSPAPPIGRSSSPSHTPAPPIERPSSSTHTPAPPIGRSSSSTHTPATSIGRSSRSTHTPVPPRTKNEEKKRFSRKNKTNDSLNKLDR
ncbi:uncharacterized protein LOC127876723 isoform X2 [Dreissena polymorpha]|uniref:uncharacterized protein LOC127876723 isoform X2 n=1 Tax=Dreissena polymorpha TaxID=45954 RepID=UPI002264D6ED|nr:uncharacterized protein LOC127876723 isoform X2 [Dreissena polymorpha]